MSIFDIGLQRNDANFVALSPVSFVERSAEVFGDLPAVGRLFRSSGEGATKRNLLIFVTARLVSPGGGLRKFVPQPHVEDRPQGVVARPRGRVDEQVGAPRGGFSGDGHGLGGRPSGQMSVSLSRSLEPLTTPLGWLEITSLE